MPSQYTRRRFLAAAGTSLCLAAANRRHADSDRALVAISFDLEMSRNFPKWDDTHWDYEKGNLDEATKRYTVEACRRVKQAGGVLHTFIVGRALEQPNTEWIQGIAADGHPVGNHTYDHVNIKATTLKDLQARFQRAPWLVEGRQPADVIRESIRLTNLAIKQKLGLDAAGFRTPGGYKNGLDDRPDLRAMLRELGFTWVSSRYPGHKLSKPMEEPDAAVLDSILAAQAEAQPFVYPDGLIEVPMSPISDIGAFRTGRWQLDWFLRAVRGALERAIEERKVFDFLAHPSCIGVIDPEFRTIDMICELVRKAGDRAAIVDLGTIAERGRRNAKV
jgi:peptidoglycan/xylan/chitin deacetylase (PgdA/CDA1 family)